MISFIPLQITYHARERLKERYGFVEPIDVNGITAALSQPNRYHVLNANIASNTVRQVKYKGQIIQAIVDTSSNKIVTFIPAVYEGVKEVLTIETRLENIENILRDIFTMMPK